MFNQGVLLKEISHYKIGGKAKYFFEAKGIDELVRAVEVARAMDIPIFILAGGTNVLINDDGFDGLILRPDFQFIENDSNLLNVGAGIYMSDLLNFAVNNSLSGLEWAGGLPGTIGGAARGNAGAFGGEMKDVIKSVISLNISQKQPEIISRKAEDCLLGYRSSIFKKNKGEEIILAIVLDLKKDDRNKIHERTENNINYRRYNHPMEHPSLGSTFKNVPLSSVDKNNIDINEFFVKQDPFPVIPAAHLISQAGLKGVSCGGAMISPKHPNFIVNNLEASAEDVINLIQLAKDEVMGKFGITLEEEIEYL